MDALDELESLLSSHLSDEMPLTLAFLRELFLSLTKEVRSG